jgi:hypothetical protein
MDLAEFTALAEPLYRKAATVDFALVEGRTTGTGELDEAERRLGVVLPEKYRTFMTRHGGGVFGFVELFPVTGDAEDLPPDLVSVNRAEFPDGSFVAVAPVGTGDHWGFVVRQGRCSDEVWFHFYDDGVREVVAGDFLAFVAEQGIRQVSGAGED